MIALFALEPIETRVLLSAGQLDPSFGSGGRFVDANSNSSHLYATAIAPDGKIVVASGNESSTTAFITRYTKSGARDTTFNGGAPITVAIDNGISDLRVLSDGRIEFTSRDEIGRLLQNGAPDTTLDPSGPHPGTETITAPGGAGIQMTRIEPDGRFVYYAQKEDPTTGILTDIYVGAIELDGSVDASFGTGGTTFWQSSNLVRAKDMSVDDDGSFAIGGQEFSRGNWAGGFLYRYSSTGEFARWTSTPQNIGVVNNVRPWTGGQFLIGFQGTFNYSVPYIISPDATTATRVNLDGLTFHDGDFNLAPIVSDAAGDFYLGKATGNGFSVTRFTPDGHTDTSFGTDGTADIVFDAASAHTLDFLNFDKTGRLILSGHTSTNHTALAALHDSTTSGGGGGGTGRHHHHRYHTGHVTHRLRYRTINGPRYRTHH